MGKAPQNLVSGIMRMSESATFTDTEVVGILLKDGEEPTAIKVLSVLTSRVKQTVAFFKEITDENGLVSVKLVNESGMKVFESENAAALESAVKGFKVLGEGLKNYKIKSDGTLAFKLPLMPLWAWMLTLVGAVGAAVGTVFGVKTIKKKKSVLDGNGTDGVDSVKDNVTEDIEKESVAEDNGKNSVGEDQDSGGAV